MLDAQGCDCGRLALLARGRAARGILRHRLDIGPPLCVLNLRVRDERASRFDSRAGPGKYRLDAYGQVVIGIVQRATSCFGEVATELAGSSGKRTRVA